MMTKPWLNSRTKTIKLITTIKKSNQKKEMMTTKIFRSTKMTIKKMKMKGMTENQVMNMTKTPSFTKERQFTRMTMKMFKIKMMTKKKTKMFNLTKMKISKSAMVNLSNLMTVLFTKIWLLRWNNLTSNTDHITLKPLP